MTYQHSVAVAENMNKLAGELGHSEEERLEAELLGAIHELSKLQTPPEVFQKLQTGQSLSDEERQKLKHPPEVLLSILGPNWLSPKIVEAIKTMACRYDGKSAEQPLAGEAIPQLSRMLKVVDTFDFLSRLRGKKTLSHEQIFQALQNNKGSLLDPILVDVFQELVSKQS